MRWLLLFALLCSAPARAQKGQPNPYLSQAKVFYQGLEYEKCLKRLEQANRWKSTTPQEAVEIELFGGLCQFNLGNVEDAEDRFTLALKLDRQARLPPYTSPKIEALFKKVRDRLPPLPPREPPPLATAEPAVPPTAAAEPDRPTRAQLEPRRSAEGELETKLRESPASRSYTAPIALGATAVVAAGLGGFMGLQAKSLEQQANAARFESDAVELGAQARQRAVIANIGFGAAAAAATGAVVTWLLSGSDEAEGAASP